MEELGIDGTAPIYGFVSDNVLACGSAGMVAKVCDRPKLEALLSTAKALEKEDVDGITVFVNPRSQKVALGVSDDAVLILGPDYDDAKKLKKQLVAMLKGEAEDNDPYENALFKRAEAADAILSLYIDLGVVPDAGWNYLKRYLEQSGQESPIDVEELQTFTYGVDIMAADHIMNANLWIFSSDEDVQDRINGLMQSVRKVDGTALSFFTSSTILGMAMNFDGEAALESYEDRLNKVLAQAGDAAPMLAEVFKLIRLVDGNVLFALNDIMDSDGGMAVVTNGDEAAITKAMADLGLSATTRNGKRFFSPGEWFPIRLCLSDKLFTATMMQDVEERLNGEDCSIDNLMLAKIRANRFTLFINTQRSLATANEIGLASRRDLETVEAALSEFFDKVHYLTITY